MSSLRLQTLIPIILYFILMYFVGIYAMKLVRTRARNRGNTGDDYMAEYMTGGRGMGGFVLAMTLVATYLSAGSFIGGPGTAYTHGLAWVFLAMTQLPTGYYTLMVLGRKFAIVSRKTGARTITDFLRLRYQSHGVTIVASLSIIFFLTAAMAAQLVGAARILEGSTGISYQAAVVFFALTVVVHTAIGGFHGVVLNDMLQGIVMTICTCALFIAVVMTGGGVGHLVQSMKTINPGMITPFGVQEGFMTIPWVTSFWILVGFAVVGLPSVSQRAMSYKDTKSLKSGIKYGTLISIILLLGMHLVGAFGSAIITDIPSGDLVVPTLSVRLFSPVMAGIILAGPLAAVMSTMDSQLLVVIGAILNDLYFTYISPKTTPDGKKLSRLTALVSFALGVIIVITAFNPPDLMVWLNLFATAGQLSTFLWPTILGLYWKQANKEGALAGMIAGISSYLLCHYFWPRPLGMHPIVLSLVISLVSFVLVAKCTERPKDEVIALFWGL